VAHPLKNLDIQSANVLVVTGAEGAGRSTLIEALYALMQPKQQSPTLWVDTTLDCGVLRKLKGLSTLKGVEGRSLVEMLQILDAQRPPIGPEIDWQLAEVPYPIAGLHEGVSLYPDTQAKMAQHERAMLVEDPYILKALAYTWPRFLAKNYQAVIFNGFDEPLTRSLFSKMPVDLLYLTTPQHVADEETLNRLRACGTWNSTNVLMTQAPAHAPLHHSWDAILEASSSWRFIGRLPYFQNDDEWQHGYLGNLKSCLLRLNWSGGSLV